MLLSYARVDVNSWARVLTEATNISPPRTPMIPQYPVLICKYVMYMFLPLYFVLYFQSLEQTRYTLFYLFWFPFSASFCIQFESANTKFQWNHFKINNIRCMSTICYHYLNKKHLFSTVYIHFFQIVMFISPPLFWSFFPLRDLIPLCCVGKSSVSLPSAFACQDHAPA